MLLEYIQSKIVSELAGSMGWRKSRERFDHHSITCMGCM
jgi:hypothetical protein